MRFDKTTYIITLPIYTAICASSGVIKPIVDNEIIASNIDYVVLPDAVILKQHSELKSFLASATER